MPDEQSLLTNTLEQEHKQLQQALRESEILRELSALLASSLDLTHVLARLTQRTVEVCHVERCAVWLHEEAKQCFVPKSYHLATQRLRQKAIQQGDVNWQQHSLSMNNPVMHRLFEQQGMLIIDDLGAESSMQDIAEQFFVRSVLLIALQREGRIVGMMSLDNPGISSTFSQEQQQLAQAIGQQAAIAIDNARLYQQAQVERQRAERLIGRAQAIFHVAMAMNSNEELPTVLGIATQHLVNGLDANGGAIALLDQDALILVSSTNPRLHAPHTAPFSPPLAQLPQCLKAVVDDSPRFVRSEDVEGDEKNWFQQLGMNNVLIVPLIAGSPYRRVFERKDSSTRDKRQCVGFAFVNYAEGSQPPSGGQFAFALDIAAQCALAIDKNAMLTRTRQAAALATERANTLDAIFDAMTEGILVLNMDGDIIVSNNTASRFLGMPLYTKRSLVQFLRAYPTYTLYGEPIAYEDFPLTRALHGEHIRGERFVTHRADAIERTLEVNVSPLLDDENQQVAIVSAFRDVTEQVRAERRIRGALDLMLNTVEAISGVTDVKELLHRILIMTAHELHCTHGLTCVYDEEQHIFTSLVSLNTSTEEDADLLDIYALFSQPLSDPHDGEPFASLFSGHATVWTTPPYSHSYPTHTSWTKATNALLLTPLIHNNHLLGVMALKRPLATNDTKRFQTFTMWDIAVVEGIGQFAGLAIEQARWQYEAEDARTKEEAMRQANELKDQFLSITAHEFRTPLTIIQTHSQLVARMLRKVTELPQRERILDGLTSIEVQTHQLTNIVNTFLEVTRINKGQVSLTIEQVDIVALVEQVLREQCGISKKHTLSSHVEAAEKPYLVLGDYARLSQVFTNLIQNAIKYSPLGGPVTVTLRQQAHESCGGSIEASIEDKGIGIPKEAQAHLFECFYRAPNAQTSEMRGVGLGLYVVSEFLRLHNGSIRVESSGEYGHGSRFILTLPLLESDALPA